MNREQEELERYDALQRWLDRLLSGAAYAYRQMNKNMITNP